MKDTPRIILNVVLVLAILAGANCGEIYGTEIMEVPVSIAAGTVRFGRMTMLPRTALPTRRT